MIRAAQLLLLVAAAGLWAASRLSWVSVQSFDGLGLPRTLTVDGAAWSSALAPMAVLLAAAALAALAVRGWVLRAMSVLVAIASLVLGYLGIQPPSDIGTLVAQVGTVFYFGFFVLMPIWSQIGEFKPVPDRVTFQPH